MTLEPHPYPAGSSASPETTAVRRTAAQQHPTDGRAAQLTAPHLTGIAGTCRGRSRLIATMCVLAFAVAMLGLGKQPADASPASFPGGYLYPTDTTRVSSGGHWLAQGSGCPSPSGYVRGLKHLGVDFGRAAGAPVYAVGPGTVTRISTGGWGTGNVGVGIRHTNSDGSTFEAIYGHVRTTLKVGDRVRRGTRIATVGPFSGGAHLHFGIAPSGLPSNGLGQMDCWASGTNRFVNPITYLRNRTPQGHGFDPCTYRGRVVGANGTSAKFLVQNNCQRAHIPNTHTYNTIVGAIGSSRVVTFASVTELNRIPNSGRTVRTITRATPSISGPSQYIRYVSGVGSRAHNGDYHWTTHAAGRPLTNEGRWDMTVSAPGVYRLQCFVPNRRDAWAGVTYRLFDGTTQRSTRSIRQADHIGWTSLRDIQVSSGTARIRLRDNEGAGPYAERFALDACRAIPIR